MFAEQRDNSHPEWLIDMKSIIQEIIRKLESIRADINLMEVCGTHTMAIARSGLRSLMPSNLKLLSGPGCPVCVTPQEIIDYAIGLAQIKDTIITTFGDMVRVPGSRQSLEAFGPKIVYSALDSLKIANQNSHKSVVFIGVGFETTSPTIAATIIQAEKMKLGNFYIIPAFKLIPPALDFIAQSPRINVQGFILPGHVSTIIGSQPYEFLAKKFNLPGCITGFEPIDILQGVLDLIEQITSRKARIDIQYTRVVKPKGNEKALEILYEVFQQCDSNWRGIGKIPNSGLELRGNYRKYDARKKFEISVLKPEEPKGCLCGRVLLGLNSPYECGLFGKKCTPLSPIGPCMVSSEGSCAAYYKYGDSKYLESKMPKIPRTKRHKKAERGN